MKAVIIISKITVLIFLYLATGMLALAMAQNYLTEKNEDQFNHQASSTMQLQAGTSTNPEPPVINDVTNGEVLLHWTAPGDDGYDGQAAGYDLRYWPARFGPIDSEYKWVCANRVNGEPSPSLAGHTDSMLVIGLESGADYYFCLKAFDYFNNYSGLSNSPMVTASNMGYVISIDTSGQGVVSFQPDQVCYPAGETVTLTAIPSGYWQFDRWSGDIESNSNPVSIIMNRDMNITATFVTDFIPGDANSDGHLYSSDITYLIGFLSGRLPSPDPYLAGDSNGSCHITGNDVTYLVNYFRGVGRPPFRGDCDNIFISFDELDATR